MCAAESSPIQKRSGSSASHCSCQKRSPQWVWGCSQSCKSSKTSLTRTMSLLGEWARSEPQAERWSSWLDSRGSHHTHCCHRSSPSYPCRPFQTTWNWWKSTSVTQFWDDDEVHGSKIRPCFKDLQPDQQSSWTKTPSYVESGISQSAQRKIVIAHCFVF